MDRTTVNIAKSQVGFIEIIVQPAFDILAIAFPKLEKQIANIKENKDKWAELVDEYEELMA